MRQAIAGDGVPGKQIHLSLEKMTVVEFLEQCKIDLQPSSVGRFNNDHADVGRPKSSTPMELTFRFFLQAIVTAGAGEATGSSKLSGSSALIYGNPGTGKVSD